MLLRPFRRLLLSHCRTMSISPAPVPDTVSEAEAASIEAQLESTRERVRVAAQGRAVRLVAVSKTKPPAAIRVAYGRGQRDFGENYLQELLDKAPLLPADIRWHFIGHLQSNKAKKLLEVPNLSVLETVDSFKLARLVAKEVPPPRVPLAIYLQVNTSGEAQKSGVPPLAAPALALQITQDPDCASLRLAGLMTIGQLGGDARADFAELVRVRGEVARVLGVPPDSLELSMGMSADFDTAVRPPLSPALTQP